MAGTTAPRRRRLSRTDRRELMLDAAQRVFGERGYRAASMDDIARGSGVTKALLYEHFASKEDLYETCVERARGRLFEAIAEALAGVEEPVQQLRVFVTTYFDELERHRHQWWALYGEASPAAVNEMRNRNAEAIAPLLAAAAERTGAVPDPVDVAFVSQVLVGAGEQAGRWWMNRPDVPKQEVTDRFVRACAGVIASLTAGAGR
ncbi:MAG TPA: TetR/AcrR family transcriptional regulator [Thermoleophilaceae bacterium]|nr:TetR/AcrR family transcriptional regulator [Thermoleophilaceae bacterium]